MFPERDTLASYGVGVRLVMIVNPAASSVTRRDLVVIEKRLSSQHDLVVHRTSRQGHATRLAHRAMKDGADVVITVGGDGTVNEAANGLLGTTCALAPLPGGSTNVFARAIGYPNDAAKATNAILDALDKNSFVNASVGKAGGRAFMFHVGIGFDASVVHLVEKRGALKKYLGHPWFIASAIKSWRSTERKELQFRIDTNDGRSVEIAQMAVALNVNPYTYLGNRPLELAPEANLTSPLSVVALQDMGLRNLSAAARAALLSSDGLPNRPGLHHLTEVHSATITSDRPFPYQLDGEPLAPVTELKLEHHPNAIRILVPTGA